MKFKNPTLNASDRGWAKTPSSRLAPLAAAAGLLLGGPVQAQAIIEVDNWLQGQTVTTDVNNSVGSIGATSLVATAPQVILGGRRNVYVESFGFANTNFNSVNNRRVASYNNDFFTIGFIHVIWDGTNKYPSPVTNPDNPFQLNSSNNLIVGPDRINPTGLAGVDLNTEPCNSGVGRGFHIVSTGTDVGSADFRISVFTSATEWSDLTRTTGTSPQVLSFPFSSFVARGNSGADGANFNNVGAIVLTLTTDDEDVDVGFLSTFTVGCGIDWGDAPQSYLTDGTTVASRSGPLHVIGGPFLGLGSNDTDAEDVGVPSVGANSDDTTGATPDDEQAVTLPMFSGLIASAFQPNPPTPTVCAGVTMPDNVYCAAVQVSNPTNVWAQVAGWIDFNGGGSFGANCAGSFNGLVPTTYACERSSHRVLLGAGGFSNAAGATCPVAFTALAIGASVNDGPADFSEGNVPPGCQGTVVLTWDLSSVVASPTAFAQLTTATTYSRFRITTDRISEGTGNNTCQFFGARGPVPFCAAGDGEVEDHIVPSEVLPVSIHSFESQVVRGGVLVSWATASETDTLGFQIWADQNGQLKLLTEELIEATASDPAHGQSYSQLIPMLDVARDARLAITTIDIHGKETLFGDFELGQRYGRDGATSAVPWEGIRRDVEQSMALRGFQRDSRSWRAPVRGAAGAADFLVNSAGMQRISYEDLLAAGLDLNGQPLSSIAVTLNGEAVARHIHLVNTGTRGKALASRGPAGRGSDTNPDVERFGPGHVIDFWGSLPQLPDSLYLERYVYRISLEPTRVRAARQSTAGARRDVVVGEYYMESLLLDENVQYHPSNASPDPWFAARLRANHSTSSYQRTLTVSPQLVAGQAAVIRARVVGVTDYPVAPDHRVQLLVNNQVVADETFDGSVVHEIEAQIPAGLLNVGANQIRVHLPGGTAAPLDLVYVDTVELLYPRALNARNGQLLVANPLAADVLAVNGVDPAQALAYHFKAGVLTRLNLQAVGPNQLSVLSDSGGRGAYWVSSSTALQQPEFVGLVAAQHGLLDTPFDLLVVAHPAFMPLSARESHPLSTFLQLRQSQRWQPHVVSIIDIQTHFGGGNPLPQALTRFLAEARGLYEFEHVLLVGGDSYDYMNRLNLGSLSFIPTKYAATTAVPHTPSDGLLADLTGDGKSDLALGRWPIRSVADLNSIVQKTLAWENGHGQARGALWVTDSEDPLIPSFRDQSQRMIAPLLQAGWNQSAVSTLHFDDFGSGLGAAQTVRNQMFSKLASGDVNLLGFAGHGAPTMWTFQGLLAPNDLAQLSNEGNPVLIGTMTCYTSYFVSPRDETVAHRWMNGFRLGPGGTPIAGATNGAIAIHGAATLSNFLQNEMVVREVQTHLLEGATLGQAVQAGRQRAQTFGATDQVLNWTLLGDPTLRLEPNSAISRDTIK